GYYLLAFVNSIGVLQQLSSLDLLGRVVNILVLREVPNYTEFFLPFIFFSLVILVARRQLLVLLSRPKLLIATGIILFLSGEILVRVMPATGLIADWGSLIYGSYEMYRFPLLQYSLVFLLG